MTSIKTYTLYETIEVQTCYFVDASSKKEAKERFIAGKAKFAWRSEGNVVEFLIEDL